ncbi:MAG: 50S ribosomal protein L5 [Candidatus Woesearchaeota archaeon]
MTSMKSIKIAKMTFNVGAGKDQNVLEKGMLLLKMITGIEPIKTVSDKRIPSWGVRPGLPVGTKITIRDADKIKDLVTRLLKAKEGKLRKSCFDLAGNVSFGIHEYIDIPGVDYDPKIGIMGFQVSLTLTRPGFSIAKKLTKRKVGKNHLISQDDAIAFMKETFGIEVTE